MAIDVIVLDGDQRSALAVVRSLGAGGKKVAVGSERPRSLAAASRYVSAQFCYPSPYLNPDGFFQRLKEYLSKQPAAVLMPMTDITLAETLKRQQQGELIANLPFVAYHRYMAASNKTNILKLADYLGVPKPRTVFAGCAPDEALARLDECTRLGFPMVIKPAYSRVRTNCGWRSLNVRYAVSRNALRRELQALDLRDQDVLLQERIEGHGIGIFLLMKDGETIAKFAHKRIREKPPSGGVSVVSESIEPPADALTAAEKILRHLSWTGVAMVEFKRDRRDNQLKLMEVNARFWGSLQLAITSGVDFPYLLFKMATGEKFERQADYKVGVRLRWELGDLDHLLLRLRKSSSKLCLPSDAPSRSSVLKDFILDFGTWSTRNEVFRWDDPCPLFVEIREYLGALLRSLRYKSSMSPL